jgi:hypothetical protein
MGRLVALILWALGSVTAHAALIPPLFINSVVAQTILLYRYAILRSRIGHRPVQALGSATPMRASTLRLFPLVSIT